MKKIVIVPDSFKGTLSSVEVCRLTEEVLRKKYDDIVCVSIPVADGGEGTLDAFMYALECEKVGVTAHNPVGEKIETHYAALPDGSAVIEMAAVSGITLISPLEPLFSSTFGTGELILSALDRGIRNIYIGIGGSATTDGGTGCLEALGAKFFDKNGAFLSGCGNNLISIDRIDLSELDGRIKECKFTVLCDVENPLYGENGAAYVFAPQKGATPGQVEYLDSGLKNFAEKTAAALGKDCSFVSGAGAAGGLGFALISYLGAQMKSGIDTVLDICGFDEKIKGADLIITGEGKMDFQSVHGKVPFGVAKRAKGVPVTAIVGLKEIDDEEARQNGIERIIETNEEHLDFEEVKKVCREQFISAAEKI
ncbi:MAG: glycerate kinase [Acutalibacteraceae bacterium]